TRSGSGVVDLVSAERDRHPARLPEAGALPWLPAWSGALFERAREKGPRPGSSAGALRESCAEAARATRCVTHLALPAARQAGEPRSVTGSFRTRVAPRSRCDGLPSAIARPHAGQRRPAETLATADLPRGSARHLRRPPGH